MTGTVIPPTQFAAPRIRAAEHYLPRKNYRFAFSQINVSDSPWLPLNRDGPRYHKARVDSDNKNMDAPRRPNVPGWRLGFPSTGSICKLAPYDRKTFVFRRFVVIPKRVRSLSALHNRPTYQAGTCLTLTRNQCGCVFPAHRIAPHRQHNSASRSLQLIGKTGSRLSLRRLL